MKGYTNAQKEFNRIDMLAFLPDFPASRARSFFTHATRAQRATVPAILAQGKDFQNP
jgi:hypothetical protein